MRTPRFRHHVRQLDLGRRVALRTLLSWSREGLASLEAGAIAAAVLGVFAFGGPAWKAIWRDMSRSGR